MGCGNSKAKEPKLASSTDKKILQGQPAEAGKESATPAGTAKKVLMVTTSATSMGDHTTGAWSEEICGPYFAFVDAGMEVTVCSIAGGDVPIDQLSLSDQHKTENDKKMIEMGRGPLKFTPPLANQDATSYDIVFFCGGHGTCVDFPTDAVGECVSQAFAAGKIVAAVCHGPIAFVNAKGADGEPLVKGKKVCCFTDTEEEAVGMSKKVPFLLESKLKELGATVEAGAPFSDKVVQDGNLVTGQNPQSSVSCAKLAIAAVAPAASTVEAAPAPVAEPTAEPAAEQPAEKLEDAPQQETGKVEDEPAKEAEKVDDLAAKDAATVEAVVIVDDAKTTVCC